MKAEVAYKMMRGANKVFVIDVGRYLDEVKYKICKLHTFLRQGLPP